MQFAFPRIIHGRFLGYGFHKTESFLNGDGFSLWEIYDKRTDENIGNFTRTISSGRLNFNLYRDNTEKHPELRRIFEEAYSWKNMKNALGFA